MNQKLFLLAALSALGLMTACGTIATPEPYEPPVDTALIEHGIEIYRSNYCGICHQLTAANTRGTFGPSHDGVGLRAEERAKAGIADSAEDYLMQSLLYPQRYIVADYSSSPHPMPTYEHLPQADLEALVYMLMHQR